MNKIIVKICGITNLSDALAASEMGADIIGFNFYPESKRFIKPQDAMLIADQLPSNVQTSGIFVNRRVDKLLQVCSQCQLDWIQLHGDETPQYCDILSKSGFKIIKAIRVQNADDIKKIATYNTDAILLDAFDPTQYGGSGICFDWSLLEPLSGNFFLAGGITADNVTKAIATGAYTIDICSGIESAPGKKDHEKMRALFNNINDFQKG